MLTEKDRAELIGLVSGFGNPESDSYARDLSTQDQEAAEFVDQIRTIASSLEPPSDSQVVTLSPDEMEQLSRGAYARWRRRRVRRILAPLAVAACLALAALGGYRMYRAILADQEPRFEATFSLVGAFFGGGLDQHTETFAPGQILSSGKEEVVLVHFGNSKIILPAQSTVQLLDSGVDLKLGQMVLIGAGDQTVTFQSGPLHGQLRSGTIKLTGSEQSGDLRSYDAELQIQYRGQTHTLKPNQQASWESDGRFAVQDVPPRPIPYWVTRAIELERPLPLRESD